jgi:hypothetical protein
LLNSLSPCANLGGFDARMALGVAPIDPHFVLCDLSRSI